jgi:hypothetical protein
MRGACPPNYRHKHVESIFLERVLGGFKDDRIGIDGGKAR